MLARGGCTYILKVFSQDTGGQISFRKQMHYSLTSNPQRQMFWREKFVYTYRHCCTCNFDDCGHLKYLHGADFQNILGMVLLIFLSQTFLFICTLIHSGRLQLVDIRSLEWHLIVSQTKVFLNSSLACSHLGSSSSSAWHLAQAGILKSHFNVSLPYLRTAGLPVTYCLTPLPAIQAACQWAHLTELSLQSRMF